MFELIYWPWLIDYLTLIKINTKIPLLVLVLEEYQVIFCLDLCSWKYLGLWFDQEV